MTSDRSEGEVGLARVVPERLKEGREARGMNMTELAARVGVTRQAISRYELGQANPSPDVISKLCRVLDLPLVYFTAPLAETPPLGPDFFRSFSSTTAIQRRLCKSRRDWVTKNILPSLNVIFDFPEVRVPHFEIQPDKLDELSDDDIELAAKQCRHAFGLGSGPISNVIRMLEANGAIVIRLAFGNEKIDAFSCWLGSRPIVVLSSDKASAVRSRFDCAHELAHLTLHHGVTEEQLENSVLFSQVERDAHRFASAFLLPADTFSCEVLSTRLDHLLSLKVRWGVSLQAIVYRCSDLGIFSEAQTLQIRKLISARGYRRREPLDDQIPAEEPSILRRAIEMLLDHKLRRPEDLEFEFRLASADIESLCSLPRGMLNPSRHGNVVDLKLRTS